MKVEILAGTECDACGSWEFECRDEQLFWIAGQLPAEGMEAVRDEEQDEEDTSQ